MTDVELHPDRIDNLQMGYLFEHLVMRFNEQANEEAGDHFTPREIIRLMAHLIYTGEPDVYKPGIFRTICDPACGTGGMLSESEKADPLPERPGAARTLRPGMHGRAIQGMVSAAARQTFRRLRVSPEAANPRGYALFLWLSPLSLPWPYTA